MLTRTDAIYQEVPSPQDGPTVLIAGRNLAHSKRSIPERAFTGADLHLNNIELVSPTIKQCACLVGVCVPYVAAAVTIMTADNGAARAAVLAGDETILDVAKAVAPLSLAESFARAAPSEWLACARMVGPAAVWDHMIAPLV